MTRLSDREYLVKPMHGRCVALNNTTTLRDDIAAEKLVLNVMNSESSRAAKAGPKTQHLKFYPLAIQDTTQPWYCLSLESHSSNLSRVARFRKIR